MPPAPPFPILISNAQIRRRTHELARQIAAAHQDAPPVLVAVMEGARTFALLLARSLPCGLPVHAISASSYGSGTQSSGVVKVVETGDIAVRGRSVLLVEDIVDTGRTVTAMRGHFLSKGAAGFSVVTLLDKPARRVVPVELRYTGFTIPDTFVVGFGMDLDGRWRELPDVVLVDAAPAPRPAVH